jgi:molecular chaperone GrpE
MSEKDIPKKENGEPELEVEEMVFDDGGEEDLRATLKKLRSDLKAARAEKQDYLTNWQKERADFLNYKKEEAERLGRVSESTREKFINDLLPVLDSYDMAFANKEAWEKVDKNWRVGVEYIHQQILKVLADYGVMEIKAKEGDKFDPVLHQPMETLVADDEKKDQTIAKVIQKGYLSGGRPLRVARVAVWSRKKAD